MEKIIRNKNILHCISGFLSVCLAMGVFLFNKIYMPYSILIFIFTVLGMMLVIETALPIMTKKSSIASACFSAALSGTIVIGNKINIFSEPYFITYTKRDILNWAIFGIVLFFLICDGIYIIQKYTMKDSSKKMSFRFWFILFAFFVVCWVPYFIIYFPGNLSPDSLGSIHQSIGTTPLNNHHPVLFTLFVKVCIQFGLLFGDLNVAVACFSVTQLLIMAAILSYSVYWLAQKDVPKYVTILCILFYALNPVVAMYSFTMWKDILFSGWMLLLALFIFDIVESNGELLSHPKSLAVLSLLCILVAFGRNNGIFVVVSLLFVLVIYVRRHWKVLLPVSISIVVVITAIQGPLYQAMNIGKSKFAESVGIPLQQIGYTLKNNGKVNQEQKDFLNQLMPIEKMKELYNPKSPDPIKFNAEFNNQFLEENKGKFIKIWAQMLIPNMKSYVKAYLMQTIGYWHIGTTDWVCQFGTLKNEDGIISAEHPFIQNKIVKLIDRIKLIPIIRNLFSVAFMVWLLVFYCMAMILKKNTKYIIPVVPLIVLWGTLMIAVPTFCEFRYMYSFHLALPLLFIMLFMVKYKNTSGESADNLIQEVKEP